MNMMNGKSKEGSVALVDLDGSNYRKLALPPGRWNSTSATGGHSLRGSGSALPDDIPDLKTPRGRYQALLQEIDKAAKIHDEAVRKAKTSEERSRIYQENFPHAKPSPAVSSKLPSQPPTTRQASTR